MKQATRDRLNALNLRFYDAQAAEFSVTRARPWAGFARALELAAGALGQTGTARGPMLRVLDVGCGNGRLIAALHARFDERFEYTGIDASDRLLAIARARHDGAGRRFVRADFVATTPESALPAGPFDLIAVLNVLHHVPGADGRAALVRAAAERVAPGGVLALSFWRFDGSPRFERRRVAAPERVRRLLDLGVDEADLERGDQLLRWGDHALRYCHFCDDAECARLLAAAELDPLARFRADGEGDLLNDYLLLHA